MMAVMCAKWVGDALSKRMYEALSELASIPFLEYHPPPFTNLLTVVDIMNSPPVCINEIESISKIIEVIFFFRKKIFCY